LEVLIVHKNDWRRKDNGYFELLASWPACSGLVVRMGVCLHDLCQTDEGIRDGGQHSPFPKIYGNPNVPAHPPCCRDPFGRQHVVLAPNMGEGQRALNQTSYKTFGHQYC